MTSQLPPDRLAAFVDDWTVVAAFRVAMSPCGKGKTADAFIGAITNCALPPYEVLATVVGNVLFELDWLRNSRSLTRSEMRVQEAGYRLLDAINLTDKELHL
jgi:hypothetical protein